MLPVPTLEHLATFSGRPTETFGAFAEQALAQATLLFSTVTKLNEYPADPDQAQLAATAISEMALTIYLEQPYIEAKVSPFQSETKGGYSYSKGSVPAKARSGQSTGLFWWDIAVDQLSDTSASVMSSGYISVMPEDVVRFPDGNGAVRAATDDDNYGVPYVRIS